MGFIFTHASCSEKIVRKLETGRVLRYTSQFDSGELCSCILHSRWALIAVM